MTWAQANEPRHVGERYPLREVRLDVGADGSLLPAGEPAPQRRLDDPNARARSNKLLHKHDTDCLEIASVYAKSFIQQAFQPHHQVPQRQILKQQPRAQ